MTTATETVRLTPADLVHRFQAEIWRYLRFLGCDVSMADDLTQETFLAVIKKPFEYRGRTEASAYLRRVARNQMLMQVRRTNRGPTVQELEIAENVWAQNVVDTSDDFLDALDDCLDGLTERVRQAIDLHYRDKLSRQEIADKLGLTVNGVKTLLRRARTTLRECIERKAKS